eukprot:880603-Pelagomonas_calceolata.AAC.1
MRARATAGAVTTSQTTACPRGGGGVRGVTTRRMRCVCVRACVCSVHPQQLNWLLAKLMNAAI